MAPTSPNPLALLFARDIVGTAADAANTLSSWDNCMAQAYCKWPVIVAIIVAALIVLSIVTCIVRCACCGLECCCWCCSCCNKCCPSPRNKSNYKQAPQQPPQTYGYHPGMSYGPPQFAIFDASSGPKKITEDSLPAMPSWQTAQTRRIEDDSLDDEDDSAFSKEIGSSDAIAMGNVKRSHEQQQLYEDPEDPMHSSPQLRDPYSQPLHQRSPSHQPQYTDDNAYPYQDRNSYAYTEQSYSNQNPSHPYTQYSQQQDAYSTVPPTPSSTYTAGYPPTYHTHASASRSYDRGTSPGNVYGAQSPPPGPPQQYQTLSPTSPTGYRGLEYTPASRPNFSRPGPAPPAQPQPQAPYEAPSHEVQAPAEMPGSLMPGGGQRYYSYAPQQPQELAASGRPGSAGISRKPRTSGDWR